MGGLLIMIVRLRDTVKLAREIGKAAEVAERLRRVHVLERDHVYVILLLRLLQNGHQGWLPTRDAGWTAPR